MELRVLRYYLAICQEKNITKAAEQLHISQPSLSRQIKNLEDELGITLFERGHHQITLTENGYYLRDRARELVNIADNTKQTLTRSQIVAGVLTIGAGQSPAIGSVMTILDQIMVENPQVKVRLHDANADVVEHKVKDGNFDFGIIMGDRPLNEFQSLILPTRNQFVAIFNQQLPLAKKPKLAPEDLVNYPLILSGQKFVNEKFHKWCGNLAKQVNVSATYQLAYNAGLLAKNGHQVLIAYHGLIDTNSMGLVERPLTPRITDPNILIWRRNAHQSNLEKMFVEQVHRLIDPANVKK